MFLNKSRTTQGIVDLLSIVKYIYLVYTPKFCLVLGFIRLIVDILGF